jgi:hypothetical protein
LRFLVANLSECCVVEVVLDEGHARVERYATRGILVGRARSMMMGHDL